MLSSASPRLLLGGCFLSVLKARAPLPRRAQRHRTLPPPPGAPPAPRRRPGPGQLELNSHANRGAAVWPQSGVWCVVTVRERVSSRVPPPHTHGESQGPGGKLWVVYGPPSKPPHCQDARKPGPAMGPALQEMLFPEVTASRLGRKHL